MPLEPKLAPCGWRCPHQHPPLTGPFGNWYRNSVPSNMDFALNQERVAVLSENLPVKPSFPPFRETENLVKYWGIKQLSVSP